MTATGSGLTAGRFVESTAARFRNRTAFICPASGRTSSFLEFDARVHRIAQALLGLGLRKGEVVAVMLGNRLELAEVYYALGRAGLIGLPLNHRSTAAEVARTLADLGAKAVVHDARFTESIAAAAFRGPVFAVSPPGAPSSFEDLVAAASPAPLEAEVDGEDPFYFNTTSGTTGQPKSYFLSHQANFSLGPFSQAVGLTAEDCILTVFPMYGRVGFAWSIVSMMLGIPNVLADFEPDRVLDLIAAQRVTTVNLVPTMASLLLAAQRRAPRDLSALKRIVFAGAPLPPAVRLDTEAELCPGVYEFYGMNEMGALCLSSPADRALRPHSVGRPLVFSGLRIVGPDGADRPAGELGEVLGRSPMAAHAYEGDPEASAATFRDGWVHTGDLGSIDDFGYLTLRGRKKDMIVSGGHNVYPAEIENVLAGLPGLAECAVIGLPDELWGERVVAVLVSNGAPLSVADVERHCREHLAGYKVPKAFVFDPGPLPRTATAKVQKFKLVERLARDTRQGSC